MSEITVQIDGLRPWQLATWPLLRRFNVLVIHRRAGKTVLAILWLLARVASIADGRGAYLAPQHNQAKRVAWEYLKRFSRAIPGTVFNEAELKATYPNGAVIYLLGADNPDALRGIGLDAVVLDEVAQMSPRVWTQIIRPALSDEGREGHALFIGTPFGMANQFYKFYRDAETLPDWHRDLLRVDMTNAINPREIEALKREMSEEDFAQEYLCDWNAAVKGAFYGKLMAEAERAGRITSVPYDPGLPVHTSWDLGMNDLTTIWYWQVTPGGDIRAIGCDAFQGTGLPEIARHLQGKSYLWGKHLVPFDANVKELGTGQSRLEIAKSLGLRWTIVANHRVQDGIEAVRRLIPRMWFDRGCGDAVEALKTYRTEYDDLRQVYKLTPLHSWESHYADAVRYFAVGYGRGLASDWMPIDYRMMNRGVI